MPLTVAVLLFVLWYCHKRGREVRLENERQLTEQEVAQLGAEDRAINPAEGHTATATGAAPSAEIQHETSGDHAAREAAMEDDLQDAHLSVLSTTVQPTEGVGT